MLGETKARRTTAPPLPSVAKATLSALEMTMRCTNEHPLIQLSRPAAGNHERHEYDHTRETVGGQPVGAQPVPRHDRREQGYRHRNDACHDPVDRGQGM